jgi:fatty acid desaturase
MARLSKTAWPTVWVLCFDALLLVAASALGQQECLLWRGCGVLALSWALLHFYLVLHECAHGAVFARARANEVLGHLLGFVIVCPFLTRRRCHAMHHAWTGHPARDPTNARAMQRLSNLSPRALRVLDVMWRAWLPFLSFNERIGLWRSALAPRTASRERRAARLYLAAYVLVLATLTRLHLDGWSYALAWLGSLMLEEAINLPHHLEFQLSHTRLPHAQQAMVTHSCASVALWSRFVLLNFNLHQAHHAWPTRPWYELPAAQRALPQRSLVQHELAWSLRQRRTPFATAFRQYITNR